MRYNKAIKSNTVPVVTAQDIAAVAAFLKAFQLKKPSRKLNIKKKG